MEKRKIFSYEEFVSQKSAHKINKNENKIEQDKKSTEDSLNEGFLDSILRFFKGMFDLFNDKKVKKDAEESQKYFSNITNDENIDDEEIEEEIDTKRVRKISEVMSKNIKDRIETDEEKGIKTSKNLIESFSSWLGMLFVYEESLHMPLLDKMTKNPEAAKRFTWVPEKFRENPKDWYKSSECKPSPEVLKAIQKISKLAPDKKKEEITKFSNALIEKIAKDNDLLNGLKNQESDTLDNVHAGLAIMANSIQEGMFSIIKNTQDQKLSEVISTEIVEKRKAARDPKTGRFTKKKKEEDKKEDSKKEERSRKTGKKSTKKSDKTSSETSDKNLTSKKSSKKSDKTSSETSKKDSTKNN